MLIHAATGGVGLVAVQFAQRVGATIFATAGSQGKVQHLRDMGVKYITSSRDAKVLWAQICEGLKWMWNYAKMVYIYCILIYIYILIPRYYT